MKSFVFQFYKLIRRRIHSGSLLLLSSTWLSPYPLSKTTKIKMYIKLFSHLFCIIVKC